jgi:hypothetical protein
MGVGELIDAAIKLYRSRWKTLMAIVAIALVPITFLQVFLTREIGSPFTEPTLTRAELESTVLTSIVLGAIQFLVVQPFLIAAVAKASADVYLGRPVLVGTTFRFAVSRIHSILWISILSGLAILLGFVLLIVPGVILLVRFYFGTTVLVVEGQKGSNALGRSFRLAQAFAAIGTAGWPFYAIGLSLAAILTTPFTTLISVLLYFDLRIRKEAFDLEIMAQEMSSQQ